MTGSIMQVIVLAGGFGTRLRPWTNHVAKPLLPMLDKTLLERVVEALPETLVDEVILAAGYKIEEMRKHFSTVDLPYKVTIVEETEPLGTGGAIANCRSHLRDETFCVMNGDLLSSVPVEEMLNFHNSQGGLATISLWEVEDPTRFGVCDIREDGKIYQFQEKPALEDAVSNMINAGCYILEPEIFERMPDGAHSMERDVYTEIASEGVLNGFGFEGHFVDAGTPPSWLEGVQICLDGGRWSSGGRGGFADTSWIGDGVFDGAGPLSSAIGHGSTISPGADVVRSALMSDVFIGDNASVVECLIGEGAKIGAGAKLEGVVVDYGAEIPEGYSQVGGTYPES
jgi:NDP-sugar pyrophosphorylase family protein